MKERLDFTLPQVQGSPSSHNASPSRSTSMRPSDGAIDSMPSSGRKPNGVTKEVLIEATGSSHRLKTESVEQFLGRLTHLKLHGLRLGCFDKLNLVPQVYVLYAYENLIGSLRGLESLRRLQQLYLQHNRITDMAGPALEALVNLKKLHLGDNRLKVIEGLQNCTCLEELHVPHQRLPMDFPLEFCSRAISAIAPTLRILDVSGNQLQDLSALGPLQGLEMLDLSDNEIDQVDDVRPMLSSYNLRRVMVRDNPWALQERRYRYDIVVLANSIEEIDRKDVSAQEREFVKRLEERKKLAWAKQRTVDDGQHQLPPAAAAPLGKSMRGPLVRSMKAPVSSMSPPVLQDLVQ